MEIAILLVIGSGFLIGQLGQQGRSVTLSTTAISVAQNNNPTDTPIVPPILSMPSVTYTAVPTNTTVATTTGTEVTPPSTLVVSPMVDVPTVTANNQWTPSVKDFSGVVMVLVLLGCFIMGSKIVADETPFPKGCFDHLFWLDKTEITQAQFKQFAGQAANTPAFTGDNRP